MQRTCITCGLAAVDESENYEARAQLFWAADIAITHLSDVGRNFIGTVHALESALSGYLNLTHGAGIAILSLAWFRFVLDYKETIPRFARWGRNVWGIHGYQEEKGVARQAIHRYEEFIRKLGLPTRVSELAGEISLEILHQAARVLLREQRTNEWFRPLYTEKEVYEFLRSAC